MRESTQLVVSLLIFGGGGVAVTWGGIDFMSSYPGFINSLTGLGMILVGILCFSLSVFFVYAYAIID